MGKSAEGPEGAPRASVFRRAHNAGATQRATRAVATTVNARNCRGTAPIAGAMWSALLRGRQDDVDGGLPPLPQA